MRPADNSNRVIPALAFKGKRVLHPYLITPMCLLLVYLNLEHSGLLAPVAGLSVAAGFAVWAARRLAARAGAAMTPFEVTLTLGLYLVWCGAPVLAFVGKCLLALPTANFIRARHVAPVALLLVMWIIWFRPRLAQLVNRWLNVSVSLVLFATILQVIYHSASEYRMASIFAAKQAQGASPGKQTKRDVYNIVLDCFTSFEQLERHWRYTNSILRPFLESNGFQVLPNARCNAGGTMASISISLSMGYPMEFGDMSPMRVFTLSRQIIRKSPVIRMFQEAGYQVMNYSFFDLRARKALVEEPEFMVPTWTHLFYWSLLPIQARERGGAKTVQRDRQVVDAVLKDLNEPRPPNSPPRFCFIHLLVSHPPFRYLSDGQVRSDAPPLNDRQAYLEQLKYAETVTTNLISSIIARSSDPPVIILQGDHGSRMIDTEESLSILSAFHLPAGGDQLLYPGITPANYFRLVAKHYLGATMDFVPDLHFTRLRQVALPGD
jgi:hypothetical protein